jgi:hypothetical protein
MSVQIRSRRINLSAQTVEPAEFQTGLSPSSFAFFVCLVRCYSFFRQPRRRHQRCYKLQNRAKYEKEQPGITTNLVYALKGHCLWVCWGVRKKESSATSFNAEGHAPAKEDNNANQIRGESNNIKNAAIITRRHKASSSYSAGCLCPRSLVSR